MKTKMDGVLAGSHDALLLQSNIAAVQYGRSGECAVEECDHEA